MNIAELKMERTMTIAFIFATCIALTFFYFKKASAHGGGSSAPSPKESEPDVVKEVRHVPSTPKTLNHIELLKVLSQEKNPPDVAVVRCTLNMYASCRGLEIALYDTEGKKLLIGHSGSEGIVGFEGLEQNQKYEARIQTKKYKGSTTVIPGSAWSLKGKYSFE